MSAWTCPCGRQLKGNGGISSHKRACLTYARKRLERYEKALDAMDAGTWGPRLGAATVAQFRKTFELERDRLRERLAGEEAITDGS